MFDRFVQRFVPNRQPATAVLLHHLEKMGKAVNNRIANVNNGGCCVYASIVGEQLRKRNIDFGIIVSSQNGNEISLSRVRQWLANPYEKACWNVESVDFNHVALEIKVGDQTYHHDTDGTNLKSDFLMGWPVYGGFLTLEEAKALADVPENWNPRFNRSYIPVMRSLVSFHMRLYDFKSRKATA